MKCETEFDIARRFSRYRVRSARTAKLCQFCDSYINCWQQYYDGGKGRRAHVECINRVLMPAKAERLRPHIRWMIRRDMESVLKIESRTSDWSEEDFLKCLRQRNCVGMVAELDERIVGYMIYELHQKKLAVLKFVVDQDLRRRRIGSCMVERLVGKLSSHRRTRIVMMVNEAALGAQLFLKSMGFDAVSVLRDEFRDGDGYKFVYRIAAAVVGRNG